MPQVRLGASSLMLEPVPNTSICLDALCHNKDSSPAFVLLNGTGICRSRRCLSSFGYRFARWLYIVDFTHLKRRKWPDVDGWADAAEASSS
ncbi:hypothetical protein T12_12158 [Trichinella patagoniensis]|uniref:Uncharacterized protein n=1 Tax=Trichinella patagoniensis TaxID=990121 RepID=A0A0V0Z5S4_9BILA|nr:hypothetical protein T12_12158 [Trichinella patagoniensis]